MQGDTLAVLKEYSLIDADTESMASAVRRDFPNFEILACPDPTGRRLQTSSAMGLSDHAILKRRGFRVRAPKAPWSIRDKLAATRLMICDANGHRRLKVHPSCKRVIRSLSNLEYKAGASVPDPKSDHSHMADAVGYACIALAKGLLPYKRLQGLLSGGRGDVVIYQAVLDVWSWGEGRHDVTKDVAVRAEVLEDFLQVLLLTVSALR